MSARWALKISEETVCNLCDYLSTVCTFETNMKVLNAHYNKKW